MLCGSGEVGKKNLSSPSFALHSARKDETKSVSEPTAGLKMSHCRMYTHQPQELAHLCMLFYMLPTKEGKIMLLCHLEEILANVAPYMRYSGHFV